MALFGKAQKATKPTKSPRDPKSTNPFIGAADVYLTKNKIAVVKKETKRTERGHVAIKRTKYYVQNDSNLKLLNEAKGKYGKGAKK